jgi:hypothetical protein
VFFFRSSPRRGSGEGATEDEGREEARTRIFLTMMTRLSLIPFLAEHHNQPLWSLGTTQNFNKHFLHLAGLKLKLKPKGAKVRLQRGGRESGSSQRDEETWSKLDKSPWSIHLVCTSSSWLQQFSHHHRR